MKVKQNVTSSDILVKVVLGIVEPQNFNWFVTKTISSGDIILNYTINTFTILVIFTHLVSILYFTWVFCNTFLPLFYTTVLRSFLIRPQLEKPVDTLEDTNYNTMPVYISFTTG